MKPLRVLSYARRQRPRFVAELKEFVRFPSVSNQPRHAHDLRRCASWLATHLRRIGLEQIRIVPTKRHPIVYAAWLHARGRPTILIYGHYDVQPAQPLQEWRILPFEPVVKDNNLYGRGACDDKGALHPCEGAGIIFESGAKAAGECEVHFRRRRGAGNSPGLEPFIRRNQSALHADAVLMSDTRMLGRDVRRWDIHNGGICVLSWRFTDRSRICIPETSGRGAQPTASPVRNHRQPA